MITSIGVNLRPNSIITKIGSYHQKDNNNNF
jgi:hypothetical protein